MSFLSNILRKNSPSQPQVQPKSKGNQLQIIQTGQLLSNRYHVSELLGRGAMGEVYLAEDNVLGGVSVAVKVISQMVPSQALQNKFAREAQISAFLGHHNVNIVRVLDFGIHNGEVPFYVMEYVYGSTLADEIKRQPLAINRCIRLMSQVCAGLQSAHQGVLIDKKLYCVLHRDLKPGNVFITSNSTFGEIAKILDFGIAESFQPNHKSDTSEAMGTLAYAPREQLMGEKLEPSADIYSLGITMFEALTGQLPINPSKSTISGWVEAHSNQTPHRLQDVAP
ncbi:MAG: serine/threonine-protein kinase, partial [Cyanobacteria bacterium P01_F01_bin.42]